MGRSKNRIIVMNETQKVIKAIEEVGYYRMRGVYGRSDVEEALSRVRKWYDRTKDACSDNIPFLNVDQPTV